jgi:hypothetical protein
MVEYVTGEMSETQTALRIDYALRGQLSALCAHIMKSLTISTRMIDDLPAVAISTMLEYARANQRNDRAMTELDIAYKDLRAAYINYGEVALKEARMRERRELHGITGEDFSAHSEHHPRPNGDDQENQPRLRPMRP